MGSNLIDLDDMLIIEARMTAEEVLDILGMSMSEFLQSLPEGSVEALMEYLDND